MAGEARATPSKKRGGGSIGVRTNTPTMERLNRIALDGMQDPTSTSCEDAREMDRMLLSRQVTWPESFAFYGALGGHYITHAQGGTTPCFTPDLNRYSELMHKDRTRLMKDDVLPGIFFVCASCGKDRAPKSCSGCNETNYCDRGCQRDHWPKHKLECGRRDRQY